MSNSPSVILDQGPSLAYWTTNHQFHLIWFDFAHNLNQFHSRSPPLILLQPSINFNSETIPRLLYNHPSISIQNPSLDSCTTVHRFQFSPPSTIVVQPVHRFLLFRPFSSIVVQLPINFNSGPIPRLLYNHPSISIQPPFHNYCTTIHQFQFRYPLLVNAQLSNNFNLNLFFTQIQSNANLNSASVQLALLESIPQVKKWTVSF